MTLNSTAILSLNIISWNNKDYLFCTGDCHYLEIIDLSEKHFKIYKRIKIHYENYKIFTTIKIIEDNFLLGHMSFNHLK